jgi:hypothetical protein
MNKFYYDSISTKSACVNVGLKYVQKTNTRPPEKLLASMLPASCSNNIGLTKLYELPPNSIVNKRRIYPTNRNHKLFFLD